MLYFKQLIGCGILVTALTVTIVECAGCLKNHEHAPRAGKCEGLYCKNDKCSPLPPTKYMCDRCEHYDPCCETPEKHICGYSGSGDDKTYATFQ